MPKQRRDNHPRSGAGCIDADIKKRAGPARNKVLVDLIRHRIKGLFYSNNKH